MAIITTPIPAFPALQDWKNLISFRPPAVIQFGVNERFGGGVLPDRACHAIEDGLGPINLDYYPIRISAMPVSGGQMMTAVELLEFIRRNLNNFVDSAPSGAIFNTYDPLIDDALWLPPFLQSGFIGSVISIDIIVGINIGIPINVILGDTKANTNPEDGSVVLSEIAPDRWIFSTIRTPNDLNHPVSGNRQFGFFPTVAGEFIFYIRGADRLTTFIDDFFGETVFAGANNLWLSFQRRVTTFVNQNGGLATIESPLSDRYDWPTIQASYFNPTETWIV
jgi:hypothetical protein